MDRDTYKGLTQAAQRASQRSKHKGKANVYEAWKDAVSSYRAGVVVSLETYWL